MNRGKDHDYSVAMTPQIVGQVVCRMYDADEVQDMVNELKALRTEVKELRKYKLKVNFLKKTQEKSE